MKALVGAFNQGKALVGAFSVIVKTGCGTDGALHSTSEDANTWILIGCVQSSLSEDKTNIECIFGPHFLQNNDNIKSAIV